MPNGDSVIIRWDGPAGAAGNTLSLMTCFSNASALDRPWRKANAVISVGTLSGAEGLPVLVRCAGSTH